MVSVILTGIITIFVLFFIVIAGLMIWSNFSDYRKTKRDSQGLYKARKKISLGRIVDAEEGDALFEVLGGDPLTADTGKLRIWDGVGSPIIKKYCSDDFDVQNKLKSMCGLESPVWVKKVNEADTVRKLKSTIQQLQIEINKLKTDKYLKLDTITDEEDKKDKLMKGLLKLKDTQKSVQP